MLELMAGRMRWQIVKRCRPQVISAYLITPQTHIVEDLAQMVANCELDAEYITVERVLGPLRLPRRKRGGLPVYWHDLPGLPDVRGLLQRGRMRQPIVMTIANCSLGAPPRSGTIMDSISLRDRVVAVLREMRPRIAYKVCEDHDILLPAFVCFDGFILTHLRTALPTQEEVDAYLPAFTPYQRLMPRTR